MLMPMPLHPLPPVRFRGRVLLVEDNPINRLVALEMLSDLGLEVEGAADGKEALEVLSRSGFDLILMDCQMPVLDGYRATEIWRRREIDESRKRTPIAAVTANALPVDRQRCLDCGMDDYLAKPYKREDLIGLLKRWLPANLAEG
jgi:CheY-like chemotaxis protein